MKSKNRVGQPYNLIHKFINYSRLKTVGYTSYSQMKFKTRLI